MRSRAAALLVAGCAALVVLAGPTGAATHTLVPTDCRHEAFKPKRIIITCADAGLSVIGVHWSSWGRKTATGSGKAHLNDCKPNCAQGHFHNYRATVTLSSDHFCRKPGVTQFKRLRLTFTGRKPSNWPRHFKSGVACPL